MPVREPDARRGAKFPLGVALPVLLLLTWLFRHGRVGPLDFWWGMATIVALGVGLGFVSDRSFLTRLRADGRAATGRKAAFGFASAIVLYGVFAAGRLAALRLFPFAASGIASVYGLKTGVGLARLITLLSLIIGPGEELFWRGFLQDGLMARFGRWPGFALTAVAYSLVHVATGNIMLVLAAGVCGVFWGWLYLARRSPLLNAVSHATWDIMAFVLWPL